MAKQIHIKLAHAVVHECNEGIADFLNDVMNKIPAPRFYMDDINTPNIIVAVQEGVNPFSVSSVPSGIVQMVHDAVNLSTDIFLNPDVSTGGYEFMPSCDPGDDYYNEAIKDMDCVAESAPINFTLVRYPQYLFTVEIY